MNRKLTAFLLLLFFLCFLLGFIAARAVHAQLPDKIPNTRIQDHAGVLSPNEEELLQIKTQELKGLKDIELGIVTVKTTSGVAPVDFAVLAMRAYGVGSLEGEHRGLLLLNAIDDRKCFIATSRHLEYVYTDSAMGATCRLARAYFQKGDYYGAYSLITDQLIAMSSQVDAQQQQGITTDQQSAKGLTFDNNIGTSKGLSFGWWLLIGFSSIAAALGLGYLLLWWRKRKAKAEATTLYSSPRPHAPDYNTYRSFVKPLAPRAPLRTETPRYVRPINKPSRQVIRSTPIPDDTPSYTPSRSRYDSDSSSSSSSSSDSSSSGFSGGSDAGGGGGGDSY